MLLKPAWDAVTRRARRRSARFPYETARWVGGKLADPGENERRNVYEDLEAAGVPYMREVLFNLPDRGPANLVEIPLAPSRLESLEHNGPLMLSAPLSFVRQWLSWHEERDAQAMIAATGAAAKAARAAAVVALLSLCAGVWQGYQSKRQADFAKWQVRASVSQELQKACEQGQQKACEQLEGLPPPSKPVRRSWWPWRRAS